MPHKFSTNGAFARALDKKTRHFYESRVFQTCSWIAPPLPATLRKHLRHLNGEVVYYRDQLLNLIEIQCGLIEARPADTNIVTAFILTQLLFLTGFNNPYFVKELESSAPSLVGLLRYVSGSGTKVAGTVKAGIEDYRKSRSIFSPTPAEASRVYKAESLRRARLLRASPGTIKIDFFSSLKKGQHAFAEPEFSVIVPIDPGRGVYLRDVREQLGVESLAIITDKGPFRPTFELANEDWLSPIAVHDLTHQLVSPIRVFEPRVSTTTKATRAIRNPLSLALVFLATLLALLAGMPERNAVYMHVAYGARYARWYAAAGRVSVAAHARARWALGLVLGCVLTACVLPLTVLYAGALGGMRAARAVGRGVVVPVCCAASAGASGIASAARALDAKGWLIFAAVIWFASAELYACTR